MVLFYLSVRDFLLVIYRPINLLSVLQNGTRNSSYCPWLGFVQYLKLPLISPGFILLHNEFLKGLQTGDLYPEGGEGAYNRNRKGALQQTSIVLIKIHFVITGL